MFNFFNFFDYKSLDHAMESKCLINLSATLFVSLVCITRLDHKTKSDVYITCGCHMKMEFSCGWK